MRRRAILLFAATAAALLLASGTALAALRIGTDGSDTLIGTSSADQITGGKGSDTLKGLAGNDVYYFADGWGIDILEEPPKVGRRSGGSDTLSFSRTTTDVTVYLIRQWGPTYNRAYTRIPNPSGDGTTILQQVWLDTSVVENAAGGMGSDSIYGGGEKNTLQPGGGAGDNLRDYGGISANTFLNPNQPGLPASNDIFKGFELNSGNDYVYDFAGTADVLDLRPFSSSGVYIDAVDLDSTADQPNGIEESLMIVTPSSTSSTGTAAVFVLGHFSGYKRHDERGRLLGDAGQQGRIEQLVFSDGTFSGLGDVGSSTASTSSEEASANNTVEGLIGASKEQAKTTKEGAELEKAAKRLLKQAQKELSDAPALPTKED